MPVKATNAGKQNTKVHPKKAQKLRILESAEERQVSLGDSLQRAFADPELLSSQDVLDLQRDLNNRTVTGLLGKRRSPSSLQTKIVQREDDITRSNISETTDTGNKYTQELVLNKTKARITVNLGVNWVKKGTWADDAAFWKWVRSVKTAAYSYLDNKFKVVCTPADTSGGLKTVELPIDFIIYDDSSGYKIEGYGGSPGGDSFCASAGGQFYEYTGGALEEPITYAHEFGHALLGASDEYANPKVPGRVLTNDHSIMANYYTQGKTQAAFKARHFQHIVTEVAKAFAGFTCKIESM